MHSIGENIRRLRLEAGWTQEELARISGISEKYISAIERGVRGPGRKILTKLCESFAVDERTIRFGDGEVKATQSDTIGLLIHELEKVFPLLDAPSERLEIAGKMLKILEAAEADALEKKAKAAGPVGGRRFDDKG